MKSAKISPFRPPELPLSEWSRGQALTMVGALVGCASRRAAWPVALGALPTFLCLLALGRRAFTPSGRFGFANAVTTLRLVLVLAFTLLPATCAASWVVALLVLVLVLDLVDGWLARTRGDASAFGGG